MISWAVLLAVGAVVGALLGLVGAGGGIVAVPALMLLGGASAAQASALSLAAVLAGALVGLLGRRGGGAAQRVDWRSVAGFLLAGIPAAAWGASTAHLLPDAVLSWALIALLVVALWRQLAGIAKRRKEEAAAAATAAADANDDAASKTNPGGEGAPHCPQAEDPAAFPVSCWINRLAVGGVVGYLTGLLGVGGGFLIVPALTVLLGLSMRRAASTSLAIIAGTSLSGVVTHLLAGAETLSPDYPAQAAVLAGATALVALVGARLSRRLSESLTRTVFLGALVVAILALIARAFLAA